jgi:hypothetical protein
MRIRLSLEAIVVRLGLRFFPAPGRREERQGQGQRQSSHLSTTCPHINATSADGLTSLRVLDVSHTNTSASNPFVPHSFEITTCG